MKWEFQVSLPNASLISEDWVAHENMSTVKANPDDSMGPDSMKQDLQHVSYPEQSSQKARLSHQMRWL